VKRLKPLIIPFLLPLLIYSLWNSHPLFEKADLAWRDFLYTISPNHFENDHVLIIAIDEPSFQQIKIRWPWPRSIHAELVEKVSKAGAAAIVFDIIFPETSPDKSQDTKLAKALQQAGNVVIGANLAKTRRQGYEQIFVEEPVPVLKEAADQTGMVNLKPDIDGTIRMGLYNVYNRPSLALAAVMATDITAWQQKATQRSNHHLGNMFFIDFKGNSGALNKVSYYQVLNDMVDPEIFKNKIVLIGLHVESAVEVQSGADAFPTPFLRFTKKMMFGVEIQGNIINTIIHNYPVTLFSNPIKWLFFFILAGTLFFIRKRPVLLTSGILLQLCILGGISVTLFNISRTILDILPGIAGVAANGIVLGVNEFRASYMERLKLRKAFSSYVAPEVVNKITRNYESLKLGGEKKEVSVLFSDIRKFTTISEVMEPEELVKFLNNYFKEMTTIVYHHKGTLDKYIGDAIMVIFGAPISMENHADQACRAALGMVECVKSMPPLEIAEQGLSLKTGVGITSGEMIVGNFGSSLRFDYTVIGDNVNLSSRLEGITKTYGVSIIISEETRQALTGNFFCRELDFIRVKGKKNAIKIYELISEGTISKTQNNVIQEFAKGLEAYRAQKWHQCIASFKKVLEYDPNDGPAAVFIDRYDQFFRKTPPREDWDGVWEMQTK